MFATVLLASLLGLAPPEGASVSLDWVAPSDCPSREQALEQLRELLPSLPATIPREGGADVEVSITIDRAAGQAWAAELQFIGERGIDLRTIEGPRCEVVASAVLLVVAVTIDPIATVEQIDAQIEPKAELVEPSPEPEPAPPDERVSVIVVEPAEAGEPIVFESPEPEIEEATNPVRVALGVLGGIGYGPIRDEMGSLAFELAVFKPWWRVGLRGMAVLPKTIHVEGNAARFDAWLLAARGCVVPPPDNHPRVELPVCVSVEGGALRGRGVGDTPNGRLAVQPWAAVGLGAGLQFVVHPRVALGIELDGLVALVHGGFTIGGQLAQRHTHVGVRSMLGVEVRLP
jgi:hypothetical protein